MAVMPSIPGMEMSVMTTSGIRLSTSAISSWPSRASAITSTPSIIDSSALMPERTRSWSSASTMRTGCGLRRCFSCDSYCIPYSTARIATPWPGPRADVQPAAGQLGALDHAVQAHVALARPARPAARACRSRRRRRPPARRCGLAAGSAAARVMAWRLGMPHHVVQRLLHQPQRDRGRRFQDAGSCRAS